MKQTVKFWEANLKLLLFAGLILILPIFWLRGYGDFYARQPQYWLWLSGIILFFALSQRNFWLRCFLAYCLCLSLYYDFIVGHIQELENGTKVIVRDFTVNSLISLMTLCVAIWAVSFVQKLNKEYLKVVIVYSAYIVFYFWIFKNFENRWIAGAYLAFCLPLILTCTKKLWLNILASIIPFIGILMTNSAMAIISAYVGVIIIFLAKKNYKILGVFCLASFIIAFFYLPKDFAKFPFRQEVWRKSFFSKAEQEKRTLSDYMLGTGLRSFAGYGIMEGADVLCTHAHNEYLEVLAEQGIIGLILIIGFIIELFLVKAPIEYKAGLAAICTHAGGYYACRLAMTGLVIIVYLGILEGYRKGDEG